MVVNGMVFINFGHSRFGVIKGREKEWNRGGVGGPTVTGSKMRKASESISQKGLRNSFDKFRSPSLPATCSDQRHSGVAGEVDYAAFVTSVFLLKARVSQQLWLPKPDSG